MPLPFRAAALLPLLAVNPASAVDLSMTPQGYTGLSITPSAHLLGWGEMALGYDRQLPGASDPDGHNFIVGFGLLPHVEMSGRIAANTIHCNLYTDPDCGIRDLSANFKAGIGLGEDSDFGLAVGATDLGGAATKFRSYYGVATYDPGGYQVSLGYARRTVANARVHSPLDGPFASVAYQPRAWIEGHREYADKNAFAGVRLFAPQTWLPRGWNAYAGVSARLNSDPVTNRAWWSLGLTIPLYRLPALPATKPVVTPGTQVPSTPPVAQTEQRAAVPATVPATVPPASVAVTPAGAAVSPASAEKTAAPPGSPEPQAARQRSIQDSRLEALAAGLKAKGLEDISVGRAPDGTIAVAVNNATYNWNLLDAVGVALGVIARELASAGASYTLIVMQRQTPIVALSGEAVCLKQWISGAEVDCTAAELFTPGMRALERLHEGVGWVVRNEAPSWRTLRIGLQPILSSNVATEYGVFDYSLGLGVTAQQPLWKGATAEVRYVWPLDNSSDFASNGVFGARRLKEGVDRALITQTLRLPLERWFAVDSTGFAEWGPSAVTAQLSLGKVSRVYDGVYGELRWEPGEGRHRVTAEGGHFEHKDKSSGPLYGPVHLEPRTAQPLLATYRYHYLPTETFLELTGGRFLNHDYGWQVALRQWFSDIAVALYYKRTRFDYQSESASFAGLEVSLPLGPRKDMSPGSLVQVRGTPRWSYAVETLTGQKNNNITTGHAGRLGLSALNLMFNSDRSGVAYFENNLGRIRDAAR